MPWPWSKLGGDFFLPITAFKVYVQKKGIRVIKVCHLQLKERNVYMQPSEAKQIFDKSMLLRYFL